MIIMKIFIKIIIGFYYKKINFKWLIFIKKLFWPNYTQISHTYFFVVDTIYSEIFILKKIKNIYINFQNRINILIFTKKYT